MGKVSPYQEKVVPAMEALVHAGLEPFVLAEKGVSRRSGSGTR